MQTLLEAHQAWLSSASPESAEAWLGAVRASFDTTLAPEVERYLRGEFEGRTFRGQTLRVTIHPVRGCEPQVHTVRQVFHRLGDKPFPALRVGSLGNGVDAWLLLATGRVMSVHHDSLFDAFSEIGANSRNLVTRVSERCAELSLLQLFALLEALAPLQPDQPDRAERFVEIVAGRLGFDPRVLAQVLLGHSMRALRLRWLLAEARERFELLARQG